MLRLAKADAPPALAAWTWISAVEPDDQFCAATQAVVAAGLSTVVMSGCKSASRGLLRRRDVVLAAATAPVLAACSSNLWLYREESLAGLVSRLGVCSAVYSTLTAGRPQPPVALGGCQTPVATDAVFQAASLTKPVFAYAVLQMVQAGVLDLGAPASRYLPRGYTHFRSVLRRAPGDPSNTVGAAFLAQIPIASLLNHTSGLPNWSSSGLSLSFEPGARWQYSGEGYLLLQVIAESVSGQPLAKLMDERVFQPLGMLDSSLAWHDGLSARAETGHAASGATRQAVFNFPVAAGSLYTTARDYARFMAALAADERLLALTLARPVAVDGPLKLDWGYGWGIEKMGYDTVLWQWGNNPGFRSFAMFSAMSKDGFVLLTNSDAGMALASALAYQTLPGDHNAFQWPMVNG